MKILYVLEFFYPYGGGVPTVFNNLTSEMVKKGHEVTVMTSLGNAKKQKEVINGVKVLRYGKHRFIFLIKSFFYLLFLREKFDIVHTSTYSSIIPTFFYSLTRRIPRVLSIHEVWSLREWLEFLGIPGFFYFLEERFLLLFPFNYFTSPSLHTKNDSARIGVPRNKIVVIPHGIETIFNSKMKKFRRSIRKKHEIEDEVVGFYSGKIASFKGVKYLLDAIESVAKSGKKVKFFFLIYRSYHFNSFIKKIKENKELASNIIVIENWDKETLAKYMAASDFVVVPSLTEGFCFAAADAASIGIPLIVTNTACLPEIVDSKNALFVKPRSTSDLIFSINRVIEDNNLRKKLSVAKRFKTWSQISDEYEKIYKKLINQ